DHRPATVPSALADDVHGRSVEGIGGAHHRTDVEIVLPVLDAHMEVVAAAVEIGHDRVVLPVPVPVDDIASIALAQQLRIEVLAHRPGAGPRTDPHLRFSAVGHFSSRESSADFASSSSFTSSESCAEAASPSALSASASALSAADSAPASADFATALPEAAPAFCARLLISACVHHRPPWRSTQRIKAAVARAWRMTARIRAMPAATRQSRHSACPPNNRPSMPSGEVNGVQDRIFAFSPDAPMMTG